MKTKGMLAVAVAGLLMMTFAGESMARGGGGRGGGQGAGQYSSTRTQPQTQGQNHTQIRSRTPADSVQTRPADSQRRDGTFLSTGMTANGSTSRPGYGNGPQDGSGLNTAPVASE